MDGIVTLEKSIGLLREENSKGWNKLIDKTEEGTASTDSLNKTMGDLLKEMRGSRFDKLEEDRERKAKEGQAKTGKVSGKSEKDEGGLSDLLLFGAGGIARTVLGILGAIPIAVMAFATGLVTGFSAMLIEISKPILNLIRKLIPQRILNLFASFVNTLRKGLNSARTGILKGVANLVGRISGLFQAFTMGLRGASLQIRKSGKVVKNFALSFSRFQLALFRLGSSIGGIARFIGRIGGIAVDASKTVRGLFKPITNAFKSIFSAIRGFGSRIGGIARVFFQIGRRLFLPLAIIMGILDGFKGFTKGIKGQEGIFNKLIAGTLGAISGILKGIIALPLDLLKSGVAWIAEKLGFENAAEILRSFSFVEIFDQIFGGLTDSIIGFKDTILKQITGGGDAGLLEMALNSVLTLMTLPADMLLNAVSWIAGKLGFEKVQEVLEGFSFFDLQKSIIDSVVSFVKSVFDSFNNMISNFSLDSVFDAISNLGASIQNGIKDMIRSILPDQDSILGKLIPDTVYEFLNEEPPPPPVRKEQVAEETSPPQRNEELSSEKEDALKKKLAELDKLEQELTQRVRENQTEIMADPAKFEQVQRQMKQISDARFEIEQQVTPVEGRNEDVPRITRTEPEETETRQRPERPDFTQRQMATAQLNVSEQERKQSEQKSMVNAVDASQRTVNNNSVSNNQTALLNPNMPAVDNLDRSWSW